MFVGTRSVPSQPIRPFVLGYTLANTQPDTFCPLAFLFPANCSRAGRPHFTSLFFFMEKAIEGCRTRISPYSSAFSPAESRYSRPPTTPRFIVTGICIPASFLPPQTSRQTFFCLFLPLKTYLFPPFARGGFHPQGPSLILVILHVRAPPLVLLSRFEHG